MFQCLLLSTAQAGSICQSATGPITALLHIYTVKGVADTIAVPVYLRCLVAVFASLGVVLAGGRLMPVTGQHRTFS